jgi:hypothetical protein
MSRSVRQNYAIVHVHKAQEKFLLAFGWVKVPNTGIRGSWYHPTKQYGSVLANDKVEMLVAFTYTYNIEFSK